MSYYKALESYYISQMDEAKAHLHTYFNHNVGIGEHSDLLSEFKKWIDVLTHAEEHLEVLKQHFKDYK
jgi:hypothetical protein